MAKTWQYIKEHIYGAGTILAVVLCVLGSLLGNAIQTDFGNVTKENLVIESSSGHRLAMNMLKPNSVTNDNPAPAIVFAHGGNGLKDKFDNYQIEWARRGFVVFSFDLYGHGDSEVMNTTDWLVNGRGLYDTVKYAATLPFVDADKIAVSGQSRGGNTIHETILLDNEAKTPLIKAVLYVSRDAIYKDAETQGFGYVPGKTTSAQAASKDNGEYFNYYGNRTVGIIAGMWDQFSFKETDTKTGKMLPNPDYLKHNNAKSFLNFGITPDASTPDGVSGKWYTQTIDGKEASRVIYLHPGFHTSQLFQADSTTDAVAFMVKAFNMNTTLANNNLIYPWKITGSAVAFAAMFMFSVFFALWLSTMPVFRGTSRGDAVMRIAASIPGSAKWTWGCLIVNTLFATGSTLALYFMNADTHIGTFFKQGQPLFSGLMCAISTVFTLIVTVVWYHCFAKKNGMDLDEIDVKTSLFSFLKTLVLALTVTGGTLILVWGAQYFFKTNFEFLYWGIFPFASYKIVEMLKVLPIFLIAYVVSSVFINCLNYNTSYGRNKVVNILILAAFSAAVPAVISGIGWGRFMITGVNDLFGAGYTRIIDGLFQTVFLLFITPITTRAIYSKTRNPYLGGLINALLVMVITCVNSQIAFPA
ncbi:alpha/beta hydrolase family protein [Bifidobacterium aerophilum]|nr:alpha/beta hydrolase [Bifidobacterium aerophilum]